MTAAAPKTVLDCLKKAEKKYKWSAFRWKNSYRLLLVTAALLSAGAAVIGKLEYIKWEASSDVASLMAATAAVITTVIAALDFEVNARINRRSRHEVSVLVLEGAKSTADNDALLTGLQEVIKRRNEELTKPD